MERQIDFLQKGTCAATVVREMEQRFQEAGFEKLPCRRRGISRKVEPIMW